MGSRDTRDDVAKTSLTRDELLSMRAEEEDNILRTVLSTFEGRRVLFNILTQAGVDTIPHVVDSGLATDIPATFKLLGRLSLGTELRQEWLTIDNNVYNMMQLEHAAFEAKYTKTDDYQEEREE